MRGSRRASHVWAHPIPQRVRHSSDPVGDLRFRRLLGERDWAALPPAVRERFGHRLGDTRNIVYSGEITECRMNWAGRLLAQLGRLIGAPLPLSRACGTPALVSVTEDPVSGGQYWMRLYGRARGGPQVIGSCKSFSGPTGLEEYVGGGFGIALRVMVEDAALHFVSDHFFWRGAGLRLRLPGWLRPGDLRVSHIDRGDGSFAFVLRLEHRWLGELVHQIAIFRERQM